jgi:hypothetical protein
MAASDNWRPPAAFAEGAWVSAMARSAQQLKSDRRKRIDTEYDGVSRTCA